MLAIILLAQFFLETTVAIPTLAYPFNSQVPPVARSGQYYNYTLPANTFANYLSDVVYSLSNNPGWLALDSTTRTLYGLPTSADVGNPSFSLLATDSTGSATDPVVLVVSGEDGPYVAIPLESQLLSMGSVDGSGGLVLKPDTNFKITFSQETFADTGGNVTAYYGTSDNYTPLPSWISFDVTTITFNGTTPDIDSTTALPQYFSFVLVGTDYPGFAGISATFQIVVGVHQLAFAQLQYSERATVNTTFAYAIPLGMLMLDDSVIDAANISSVSVNTTGSWLGFNNVTNVISGIPKTTDDSVDLAVTVIDKFGDAATASISVQVDTSSANSTTTSLNSTTTIFAADALPSNFNVTAGSFFTYTFNTTVIPSLASLNVTISNVPWLHYNPANRTLYGQAPNTTSTVTKRQLAGSTSSVTVTASQGGQSQSQTVTVSVTPASSTSQSPDDSSTSAQSTATPTASTSTTASSAPGTGSGASHPHGLSRGQKIGIAIGVVLAVILLAVIAALVTRCCIRRNQRPGSANSVTSNISRPELNQKDEWPQAAPITTDDEPHQIDAFQMFKSTSEGRLSGYAVEVNHSGILAPPLATLAHELPPLPESPTFDAVRSAYSSDGDRSRSTSLAISSVSNDRALSVNNSIGNIPNFQNERRTIKSVINTRRSNLQQQDHSRDSAQTIDTVSTDELFSVRLIGSNASRSNLAPPIARFNQTNLTQPVIQGRTTRYPVMTNSETQYSERTIGTYTSSEGDYIQRYASQGESLSSNEQPRTHLDPTSYRNDSQAQPWRVINSEESYDSFGSYATTDSNLSDEFSFDDSHSGATHSRQEEASVVDGLPDSANMSGTTHEHTAQTLGSDDALLAAPLSPDWTAAPRHSSILRRPTLTERVASTGKGKLKDFTAAKRPTSNPSFDNADVSMGNTTGSSAEIAFI